MWWYDITRIYVNSAAPDLHLPSSLDWTGASDVVPSAARGISSSGDCSAGSGRPRDSAVHRIPLSNSVENKYGISRHDKEKLKQGNLQVLKEEHGKELKTCQPCGMVCEFYSEGTMQQVH